jgi:RND family efflux transporter MFP subunit
MTHVRSSLTLACALLIIWVTCSGCSPEPPDKGEKSAVTVTVSKPIERDVADYVDFTGRTDAVFSLDVRARVTGYLVEMPFVEGAVVKKGDLLFRIDPRPYQAQYDQAQAQVTLCGAKLKLAKADNVRAKGIYAMNPGAMSRQDLDKYQAAEEEAAAEVEAAKAALETHNLNLGFTEVASPIDGRVSRYYLTLGNLVNQDQTLLTTVVSEDPMYAYFDVDEMTVLRIARLKMQGNVDYLRTKQVEVLMGLEDETGFPHRGYADFANNVVDKSTGTVSVRGVFANPNSPSGRRLLRPGMFVRIRLMLGNPRPAVLVADQALATDQGQKYLLVVDDQNTVQYRRVEAGPLQEDGLRVIKKGLKPDEMVIVSGLQLVRPRMKVEKEVLPMPTKPAPAAEDAMPAPASSDH